MLRFEQFEAGFGVTGWSAFSGKVQIGEVMKYCEGEYRINTYFFDCPDCERKTQKAAFNLMERLWRDWLNKAGLVEAAAPDHK